MHTLPRAGGRPGAPPHSSYHPTSCLLPPTFYVPTARGGSDKNAAHFATGFYKYLGDRFKKGRDGSIEEAIDAGEAECKEHFWLDDPMPYVQHGRLDKEKALQAAALAGSEGKLPGGKLHRHRPTAGPSSSASSSASAVPVDG